ncbi:MAG TPA: oligopeptide transporter, OPT family [Vicinamibacterales bacterium]|nr:oligopeptide transporter, OPT family [Vicinamibacterales bacterium]
MAKTSSVESAPGAWSSTAPLPEFRPYVPEHADVPEFTAKAIIFGALFGLIFGAVTVYVGLRAGLTVSASIPIAVLSISLLRAFGRATILENNIVQTTGSAGESVAAGAIFTLPALIFMGFPFEYSRIFFLALIGGWIGVLFMIPLRRQLIVQEHGNLLYPEGTACADVLVAGEKGGSFAGRVFWGLGLGGGYTFLMATAQMWKQRPLYEPSWLPGASFRAEITSEYLGVGYIIGPRIAGTIFAGGVFSWLVLMPAIKFFGEALAEPLYPSTIPIRDMTPSQMWESYIRPMGAGAVAMAGLITLLKTMPTIVNALRSGMRDIRAQRGAAAEGATRLNRDISMRWVVLGSLAIIVVMWLVLTLNPIEGAPTTAFENFVASIFVVVFGFLFVTVSSRICGLIGTSANPVSGMTIATLMATCAMFLVMGWTEPAYAALAIIIGGVVCVAAANAGATSQDLKTGFLVGATPQRQQVALMVGVMVSVFVIGATLMLMNFGLSEFRPMQQPLDIEQVRATQRQQGAAIRIEKDLDDPNPMFFRDKKYILVNALGSRELPDGKYLYDPETKQIEVQWITGIGSDKAAAPQGRLMATVVTGILNQRLPWRLVAMGVFLVIAVELLGIRSLSFAVGSYLGLHTTLAIFCGGIVRWAAERGRPAGAHAESEVSPGSLYASGLIAAGGVLGLIAIVINVLGDPELGIELIPPGVLAFGPRIAPGLANSDIFAVLMFVLLAYSLYHFAKKRLD